MDFKTIVVIIIVLLFFVGSFILIRVAEKELAKNMRKRAENSVTSQLNDLDRNIKRSKHKEKKK